MVKTKTKKTNKQWYPYTEWGSYFKLDEGNLLECDMNDDGTRDEEEGSIGDVDWEYNIDLSPEEKQGLKAIVKELEEKE